MNFEGFTGREERLRDIIRFNMERRTPMFYRTNLSMHSQRIEAMTRDVAPFAVQVYGNTFSPEKASTLARVHDDAELITGDIQVYHKDRMTPEQLRRVDDNEAAAIEILANQWPEEINGFTYRALLYHALHKDCVEAQVVSWLDKIEGLCECLHEMHAGNQRFVGAGVSYVDKIYHLPEKHEELQALIGLDHPLLQLPQPVHTERILHEGRFHTEQSVRRDTGIPHYDRWKELTMAYFGIGELVDIRER